MPCGEAFFEYSTMTRRVHHKILKSGCKAEESRLRTADSDWLILSPYFAS
jgi:hypothetical protein